MNQIASLRVRIIIIFQILHLSIISIELGRLTYIITQNLYLQDKDKFYCKEIKQRFFNNTNLPTKKQNQIKVN
ncbi:unnamed protein product [Paramecium pentaurelia]|uniref:Transmembrane protein n=1 Tax=Paramecium pentaurelia TaxID=43138 RepID=A0A8S1XWK3_9CILI|nr:unnamed protein product [Paramecium pentaurelia]